MPFKEAVAASEYEHLLHRPAKATFAISELGSVHSISNSEPSEKLSLIDLRNDNVARPLSLDTSYKLAVSVELPVLNSMQVCFCRGRFLAALCKLASILRQRTG